MQGVVTPILTMLHVRMSPVEMAPWVVIILRNRPERNGTVPLHYSAERNHNYACTLYTYIA